MGRKGTSVSPAPGTARHFRDVAPFSTAAASGAAKATGRAGEVAKPLVAIAVADPATVGTAAVCKAAAQSRNEQT